MFKETKKIENLNNNEGNEQVEYKKTSTNNKTTQHTTSTQYKDKAETITKKKTKN